MIKVGPWWPYHTAQFRQRIGLRFIRFPLVCTLKWSYCTKSNSDFDSWSTSIVTFPEPERESQSQSGSVKRPQDSNKCVMCYSITFQVYAQTLHSPPPSSTSAATIVSVHSSNDFLTSPTQSAGDMKSPRSPLSPVSPPGGGHYGTSHKIPAATPSSDSMSFPSPPSEAFHSNATTPYEEPQI